MSYISCLYLPEEQLNLVMLSNQVPKEILIRVTILMIISISIIIVITVRMKRVCVGYAPLGMLFLSISAGKWILSLSPSSDFRRRWMSSSLFTISGNEGLSFGSI